MAETTRAWVLGSAAFVALASAGSVAATVAGMGMLRLHDPGISQPGRVP